MLAVRGIELKRAWIRSTSELRFPICAAYRRPNALEALGGDVVFEWIAALCVTSTGISVWQSSRDSNSVRLFDLRWSDVRDVRLVMTAIFSSTTPTLQLSFVTRGDHSVVVPLMVRRGFGSVVGLGHGQHIEGIEAKV